MKVSIVFIPHRLGTRCCWCSAQQGCSTRAESGYIRYVKLAASRVSPTFNMRAGVLLVRGYRELLG